MRKGPFDTWRQLGRIEQIFLLLVALYTILYFTHVLPLLQSLVALAAFCAGLMALFRLARRGMKKAIWRLRNRLLAAYVFIAVVPVVLIVMLVLIAGWAVIGQ